MINNILKTQFNYEKIYKYILLFLPLSFITGPFISGLALSLMSIYGLYYTVKYKRLLIDKNFFFLFISFFIYIIISSSLSSVKYESYGSSLFFIRYLFFFVSLSLILSKLTKNDYKFVSVSFIFYLVFLFADSFFQFFFGVNLAGIEKYHEVRISSFFADELILGSYISKIIPIITSVIFLSNLKNKEYFLMVSIILSLALIFFSAERTALVIYFVFLILILLKPVFSVINRLIISLALLVSFSMLAFTDNSLKERIIFLTMEQITAYNKINIFSHQHTTHFKTAYNIFLDNKFIGAGPKSFRYLCSEEKYFINEDGCSTHPHNYYIQILSETGIVGLLSLILFYLWIVKIYITAKLRELSVISAGIVAIYFPLVPSMNFFGSWNLGLISITLGLMLYIIQSNKFK